MDHEMHLDPVPFEEVRSGVKTVEVRLYDEKRQKIRVGDRITFKKRHESANEVGEKEVVARVAELHRHTTINALVDATPLACWGPRFKDKTQLLHAVWHYTPEEVAEHGLLAIYVRRE